MYCKLFNSVLMMSFATIVMASCLASMANAELIADWQFNDGDLLVDSSGNGNTLVVAGGTVDNTGGNAVFSGSGWLQTASDLDLTGYRQVTVSFGVNCTTPVANYPVFFEQNTPFYNNPGSIFAHLGPGANVSTANYSWYNEGIVNYNVAGFTSVATAEYVMNFDLGRNLSDPTAMVQVYIDGVLSSVNTSVSLDDTVDFATGLFNIGARGDASLNMSGTMSYFTIEGVQVPEPGTALLLATGLIGLLACAWRKRR